MPIKLRGERVGHVTIVTAIFRAAKSLRIGVLTERSTCFLRPDRAAVCEVRYHTIPGTDNKPHVRVAILTSHAGKPFWHPSTRAVGFGERHLPVTISYTYFTRSRSATCQLRRPPAFTPFLIRASGLPNLMPYTMRDSTSRPRDKILLGVENGVGKNVRRYRASEPRRNSTAK